MQTDRGDPPCEIRKPQASDLRHGKLLGHQRRQVKITRQKQAPPQGGRDDQ